jgi:hypothetical protein
MADATRTGSSVARRTGFPIHGFHVLAVIGLLLWFVAIQSTELYTSRNQTLPVLDWVESRWPVTEAADVPAAADLARGLAKTQPLLVIRDDARSWLPIFGPPAVLQRSIGGVRDAAQIVVGSPGTFTPDAVPIRARLYTVVFNRTLRAADWAALMKLEMDTRDPDSGLSQVRVTGPDAVDAMWIVSPRQTGGIATVVGHRGPVAFDLQVTLGLTPEAYQPQSTATRPEAIDMSGRAETLARQMASDWSAWLAQQVCDAPR